MLIKVNISIYMKNLTVKQKRFCEEYSIDFNGKKAAIRAGYSTKTATEQASRLLSKKSIQEYLRQIQKQTREKMEMKKETYLNRLNEIQKTTNNNNEAIRAIRLIGKWLGFDKADDTVKQEQNIKVIISDFADKIDGKTGGTNAIKH
ncbi:hypothetical protein GF362_04095 [Candidatus Dojkabacteria bacterium]|nr:hypothetical protein [Candidatus Dojkabacteria bacterium]